MIGLTYLKFLETLQRVNHYAAPLIDEGKPKPLERMPDGYVEAITNEVTSGGIHPVILSRSFIQKHALSGQGHTDKLAEYADILDFPFEIPLPFDGVWIEFLPEEAAIPMLGGALAQFLPNTPWVYGYFVQSFYGKEGHCYSITAFIVVQSPSTGKIIEVCTVTDVFTKKMYQDYVSGGESRMNYFGFIWHNQLFDIFNRMSRERQVGIDRTTTRIRVGTGENRKPVKIKNIVYVIPSAEQKGFNEKHGTAIDWTHRWEVRGHWRKIEHIGKDPVGNYCVPGMTWVSPSIKGPEKAPLVKKTRYALVAKEPTKGE